MFADQGLRDLGVCVYKWNWEDHHTELGMCSLNSVKGNTNITYSAEARNMPIISFKTQPVIENTV